MKNSNDTVGNRTRDLPTCGLVIVCESNTRFMEGSSLLLHWSTPIPSYATGTSNYRV